MKRIIIIAELFAPNNHIASVRVTKLAKLFKTIAGYNITVISRKLKSNEIIDPVLNDDLRYIDNHIIIDYSKIIHSILGFQKSLVRVKHSKIDVKISSASADNSLKAKLYNKILSFIRNSLNTTIDHMSIKNYTKKAIKYIKKNPAPFDVVLSSFEPFSAHLIGGRIKELNPLAFWIADFRDPVLTPGTPKKYIKYFESYINKVSKTADVFTGVSDACIKVFKEKCKNRLFTICNGFDRDDLKNITPNKSEKLTFTYTGQLYRGQRDLGIILKAINELITDKSIDKNNILICYAGNSEIVFKQQIGKYNLSEMSNSFGFIDRRESLQLQLSSSILLLASWNNIGDTGVVTGKFLEYLMINKPIICAVAGNLADSQLKEMITEANNGVVWEEANDAIDYPILKSYILEQYNRFMNNETLLFNPNMEYIEQYNYTNITRQFINLIENYCK